MPVNPLETSKALDSAITFCQSFGQTQGLHIDNYMNLKAI
jgi:hypothetical protein